VRDLLDQGIPGEVIRFVMLSTHYRKPMDWTAEKAREAEATLRKWYGQAAEALDNVEPHIGVLNALADDLNTAGAIAELHQLSHAKDQPSLRASMRLLGFMDNGIPDWVRDPDLDLLPLAKRLERLRDEAMQNKDFLEVDRMKAALIDAGVEVRMSKEGVELVPGTGFDAAKLEALE